MDVKLVLYSHETAIIISFIKKFWQSHNQYTPSDEEAFDDLTEWTKEGHRLYLINYKEEHVGFAHLGSRGCEMDWLEDIFVLPEFQGKGIGTCAIKQVEDIVKEYSEALYIEAAARNRRAIRLYQKIGYTCLNTITVRKDFQPKKYETVSVERIMDMDFDVKQRKK